MDEVKDTTTAEVKDADGNDNLRDNQVDVEIEPKTVGNHVYVNICSCSLFCCVS